METILKETSTNEEIFLQTIFDFFDCRTLSEHLIYLDDLLINKNYKKQFNEENLHFISSKIFNLLVNSHSLMKQPSKTMLYFEESLKIPEHLIQHEQKKLSFYPIYLRNKEICNPLKALLRLFKNHSLDFYKKNLENWINEGLANKKGITTIKLTFPLYIGLKKMMGACWLIHERAISKNSYKDLVFHREADEFSLSCPLLLQEEYLANPYLMIESFFSFACLNEYREDLTHWFKAALNENICYEQSSDLLFIHDQFTQLIHAGYLIGLSKPVYEPQVNYTKNHETFGHWLLDRMEYNYVVLTLSPHYNENPIDYCAENLTLDQVTKLRYGLKEWLDAALSKNNSITSLNHMYIFDQYEELQKIVEALFLLIIEPALSHHSPKLTTL